MYGAGIPSGHVVATSDWMCPRRRILAEWAVGSDGLGRDGRWWITDGVWEPQIVSEIQQQPRGDWWIADVEIAFGCCRLVLVLARLVGRDCRSTYTRWGCKVANLAEPVLRSVLGVRFCLPCMGRGNYPDTFLQRRTGCDHDGEYWRDVHGG
jgi:hypothetical protein